MVIRNRPINNNHQHLCHHLNKKLLWNPRKRREKIVYSTGTHNRHLMSWLLSSSPHHQRLQDGNETRRHPIRSTASSSSWSSNSSRFMRPPLRTLQQMLLEMRYYFKHSSTTCSSSLCLSSLSCQSVEEIRRWINPLLSCVLIICGLGKIIEFRGFIHPKSNKRWWRHR